ncbi:MAG: AAA family ATPase [Treponema sp.]|jgi:exonuclease SbcC|nr:AAA family ATPase [Treponema sp.]
MKIRRLVFENINSLAGKWEIDFTDPSFSEGIFILSGPTGAGKTTILDAVCLGLYGKTSRQSIGPQKNEVMTKGTRHCFSQVEFESLGKVFRSLWEHRQKKGNKSFAGVTRKIYEITGGEEKAVAESVKDAEREIAGILKMDFTQFTSAVLLPQGKFDQFLNAEKKVRSEILEKITGARVYSEIGTAVHKRKTEEDHRLELFKAAAGEVRTLSAEEEEETALRVEEQNRLAAEKSKTLRECEQKLAEGKKHEALRAETGALRKTLETLKKEESDQAAEFAMLETAKKANELSSAVADWEQRVKEKDSLESEIAAVQKDLEDLAKKEAELTPLLAGAEVKRNEAEERYRVSEPLLKLLRTLSFELQLKRHGKTQKTAELRRAEAAAAEQARGLAETEAGLERFCLQLAEAKVEQAGGEERRGVLLEEAAELQNRIAGLSVFSSAMSFEEARKKLKTGEPCPLCGSADHPFCTDPAEFENLREQYRNLAERRERAEKNLGELDSRLLLLGDKKNRAEKNLAVAEERKNSLSAALKEALDQKAKSAEELEVLEKDAAAANAALDDAVRRLPGYSGAGFPAELSGPAGLQPEHIDALEQQLLAVRDKTRLELAELGAAAADCASRRTVHEAAAADKRKRKALLAEEESHRRQTMEAGFAAGGFENYAAWQGCFWETSRILKVEGNRKELAVRIANAETVLLSKEAELEEIIFIPGESADIEEKISGLREEIQFHHEDVGSLKNVLAENAKRKAQKADLEKTIAGQSETCRRWKMMDDWIGGDGGWRFKQYAQAITFQQLVYNSRPFLLQMSAGRYELRAKPGDEELLPLVIDRHQGSIERVISNLSGGEGFLLSLSLALGLSRLNSVDLPIDSLFLDEGFGSLDRETLELAVNVLSGLQQNQGKLTGIISHVEELQERIGACVRVSKSGGGRSVLSGCGVRRL